MNKEQIINAVLEATEISRDELFSRSRAQYICDARKMLQWLLYYSYNPRSREPRPSLENIASLWQGYHHTSVMWNISGFELLASTYAPYTIKYLLACVLLETDVLFLDNLDVEIRNKSIYVKGVVTERYGLLDGSRAMSFYDIAVLYNPAYTPCKNKMEDKQVRSRALSAARAPRVKEQPEIIYKGVVGKPTDPIIKERNEKIKHLWANTIMTVGAIARHLGVSHKVVETIIAA